MPLSHVLDLSLVVFSLLLDGFLQLCNLLFTLGPTENITSSPKCTTLQNMDEKCSIQYLSSCWAAVVSRVSSSSVFRASSSSLKSLLSFSALFLACFSDSRSSCSSDSCACSSRICFRALFLWLTSSSLLKSKYKSGYKKKNHNASGDIGQLNVPLKINTKNFFSHFLSSSFSPCNYKTEKPLVECKTV